MNNLMILSGSQHEYFNEREINDITKADRFMSSNRFILIDTTNLGDECYLFTDVKDAIEVNTDDVTPIADNLKRYSIEDGFYTA